jgi:putative transposase
MLKNHKLAKAIQDSSWSSFVNLLEYKCKWYGRTLIKVDRFFPSSKTCSDCGYINQNLKLKDRDWICKGCGVVHQRDWNASKNILKQGLNLVLSFGTNDYRHGGKIKPGANSEISDEMLKVSGFSTSEAHSLVL